MTRFLDTADLQHLLQRLGPRRLIAEIAAAIAEDFGRWEQFDKSARVAHHGPDGVLELMPVSDGQRYAFKYVNGHPRNPQRGLPTVMAFGVLADFATGYPLLLSELTLTTALRTAATSALAARALARPGASTLALIGNGAQSDFQALGMLELLGPHTLRLFDVDEAATARLARNLAPYAATGQLRLVRACSAREAAAGADIVTTATADKTRALVLRDDMVSPGTHLNAIGGDCPGKTELDAAILRRARVVVEFAAQTRLEGEIQQLPHDFPVTELWQVLAGRAPGRMHDDEVTVFDSVGFALEDFSALRVLDRLAREHGLGRLLSLVPRLPDPKDLFGWAMAGPAGPTAALPSRSRCASGGGAA